MYCVLVACGDDDDDSDDTLSDDDDNDSADDDDSEDDDDSGDDDDDDDGEWIAGHWHYDDGTAEENFGADVGDILAIAVKPEGYPAYLTELYAWNTGGLGDYRFVVYADENENGPDVSELVYTSKTFPAVTGNPSWFVDFLASGEQDDTIIESGAWIVGIAWLTAFSPTYGIDLSTTQPASYFYDASSGAWQSFNAFSGIPMIQAKGFYWM